MKIELLKNYYIKQADPRNWVVAKMEASKKGIEYEEVYGYYPNFEMAINRALDKFLLKAKDKEDMLEIIEAIYKVKGSRSSEVARDRLLT